MNRIDLANKRSTYKSYEARLKRQFRRIEGNTGLTESVYEELDQEFYLKEIKDEIHNLKLNKSPGMDELVNELFILCEDIMSPILLKLFNQKLNTGVFPQSWCCGVVIPVYMKGKCI